MSAYISLLVAVLGLMIYLLTYPKADHARYSRVGEIMFFTGLLVFLFEVGTHSVHLP